MPQSDRSRWKLARRLAEDLQHRLVKAIIDRHHRAMTKAGDIAAAIWGQIGGCLPAIEVEGHSSVDAHASILKPLPCRCREPQRQPIGRDVEVRLRGFVLSWRSGDGIGHKINLLKWSIQRRND